jgi:DNA repair protein RadA/Sms
LIIVDSVQTVFSLKFQSAPGSIGRGARGGDAAALCREGAEHSTFLVATSYQGRQSRRPKVLEHIVDTVLYFEGEKAPFPSLSSRAVKNRFGAVSELGVFEMTGKGLKACPIRRSCSWPSGRERAGIRGAVLHRRDRGRCSSKCRRSSAPARTATRAGWRAASIRTASRCSSPSSRKRAGLNLLGEDVFINVAGGMTVDEPAADLAVVGAVASSLRNRPIRPGHGGLRRSRPGRRRSAATPQARCACGKPRRWASRASSSRRQRRA